MKLHSDFTSILIELYKVVKRIPLSSINLATLKKVIYPKLASGTVRRRSQLGGGGGGEGVL